MEQTSKVKSRNSSSRPKGKNARNGFQGPRQAQGKGKPRKKGRAKAQAISGFSTLSQVSGAPLVHSYHSSIEVPREKVVVEPLSVCAICGEKIQTIADCFSLKEGYAHFDCVLDRIKKEENPGDGECISYVGSGSFAVLKKGEDGKFTIVRKIDVENKENFNMFKSYVESLKK